MARIRPQPAYASRETTTTNRKSRPTGVLAQRRERSALIGAAGIEAHRQPESEDAHGAVDESAHNIAETGCALRPRIGDDLLGVTLAPRGRRDVRRSCAGDRVGGRGTTALSLMRARSREAHQEPNSTVTGVRPMRSLSATTAVLGLVVIVRELELKARAVIVRHACPPQMRQPGSRGPTVRRRR